MATKQKSKKSKKNTKTTKRSTDTAGKSAAGKKSPEKKPSYNPVVRLVGGLICLLLALCLVVSLFRADALFLAFFSKLVKGLFGYIKYGYFPVIAALIIMAVILFSSKDRPVLLRNVCTLLLAVLTGSLLHLLFSHASYGTFLSALKDLWADGQAMLGGGVISGGLAVGLRAILGTVVSVILVLILILVALAVVFRLDPSELAAAARERIAEQRKAREEQEEPEEPEIPQPRRPVNQEDPRRRARRVIDFPLDDDPAPAAETETPVDLTPPEKKGFFVRRDPKVRTPAEVLDPAYSEPESAEQEPAPEEKKPRRRREKELTKEDVAEATEKVTQEIESELAEPEEVYHYPPVTLLEANLTDNYAEVGAELRNNSRRLADTLRSFGVDATAGEVVHGPSVTRYEFMLDQGVKLSKITNLSDDIALALGVSGVRIAPIPNKISVVGIEVPNRARATVKIRDIIESRTFTEHKSQVAFVVGKDIGGNDIVGDISRLPHVLIAGTTGSGKSVCTNSLIISLLYRCTPEEVRFIMVDPKMVELAPYNGIPHLLIPVVTDPKKAAGALQWAVFEMMKRYKMFSEKGVKDLKGYNALAEQEPELKKLPTVVVVIDELADLMIAAAKEVEESICRVAQMGRAAGMHLVIATQSPRADIITGLMKANIPSRIALTVASSLESRIILDTVGAEKLVSYGDMLYFPLGMQKPLRVQGCFVTPEEIERVVDFVKQSGEANYDQGVIDQIEAAVKKDEKGKGGAAADESAEGDDYDELLPAAVDIMLEIGQASTSMLQRKLKLGYSRASRLVDQMEEHGYVGPFNGSKPREILITKQQWQELKMKKNGGEPELQPEIDRYGTVNDVFNSHDALD